MVSLVLLPDELLLSILNEAAHVRSIKRALRLRLVCKRFSNLASTAIFSSGILNCQEISDYIYRAPEFWAEYFAYLTLTYSSRKSREFRKLLLIAQKICRYRHAKADGPHLDAGAIIDEELRECVLELCRMVTFPTSGGYMTVNWPTAASADVTEGALDESALDFRRHLLSAAAWLGEESLVIKLLKEGCNWFDGPSLFLEPIRAASYRGHIDIVKILMVDSSINVFHVRSCPTYIANFFNDHTPLLDVILGPSWQRCNVAPEDIHKLRRLALNETRTLETLKRLLKDAKPHIINDDRYWLCRRTHEATDRGQADIVKYMIEEEGVKVNDDKSIDTSIFLSRHPVEFEKGSRLWYRDAAFLSMAARRGHSEIVKFLLDAGAYPDHAIEFAAMSGSRTIIRVLWEHNEYENDAVQGAFVLAVDREDTAVFNLLKELGAKLDDDVRVALIERAQNEGLDSMVRLLDEDALIS
ncbi:hypothetical protein HBI56_012500 [Parastagonospora nodorum]|nr:hypothetical protein HBI10_092850 [Parastagonospora nodorum]KAH4033623.1 hypothetical protein HBI13_012900 [Parastagonospora nodorum]KAH4234695.1 hypothetical protein HBI06_061050 [Parastagonospora nodorum]KAH4250054.1 hypothetical protein HBI05_013250 [Parastagonospora nodorum]KAH4273685.1 hypothetical protein HBI03_007270 [Parastagonospora nodorum]